MPFLIRGSIKTRREDGSYAIILTALASIAVYATVTTVHIC